MCHLVRDDDAVPQPRGTGALPGSEGRRRRWLSGAAVAVIGGLALAGWGDLQPGTRSEVARQSQAPVAVVPVATTLPATESTRAMTPADDGVPTAAGKAGAAAGNCEYGL